MVSKKDATNSDKSSLTDNRPLSIANNSCKLLNVRKPSSLTSAGDISLPSSSVKRDLSLAVSVPRSNVKSRLSRPTDATLYNSWPPIMPPNFVTIKMPPYCGPPMIPPSSEHHDMPPNFEHPMPPYFEHHAITTNFEYHAMSSNFEHHSMPPNFGPPKIPSKFYQPSSFSCVNYSPQLIPKGPPCWNSLGSNPLPDVSCAPPPIKQPSTEFVDNSECITNGDLVKSFASTRLVYYYLS